MKVEYLPFQPSFESKKNYQNYAIPSSHMLFGLVTDFYQFSSCAHACSESVDILPDACCDLFFTINENRADKDTEVSIKGSTIVRLSADIDSEITIFGIRFFPGAVKIFFDVQAEELINSEVPLAKVVSREQFYQIQQVIRQCSTFEKRVQQITELLLKTLEIHEEIPAMVLYSVQYMIEKCGAVRIDGLAEQLGYSSRYFRRVFTRFTGLSPKTFSEIIRFQISFFDYSNHEMITLTNLAAKYGYSDHAQMDKAYIKYSCLPPTKLRMYYQP